MQIHNYPFYNIHVDDNLYEGKYFHFNKTHVFVNYKFYQWKNLFNIKKDHHIHIYIVNMYNVNDGFYKFINEYSNIIDGKIFIHVGKYNTNMKTIVRAITNSHPKLKLIVFTKDSFTFNKDDHVTLHVEIYSHGKIGYNFN